MLSLRRLAFIALAGMALAACGGRGSSSLVPGAQNSQSTQSAPRSSQTVSTASPGTLYAADGWHVYAYSLTASDPATIQRTIVPHPKQINTEIIQGIATGLDGTLAVLQNYFVGNDEYCRTVIEAANADIGTLAVTNVLCDPTTVTQGEAIARSPSGFDVVYRNHLNGVFTSSYAIEHLTAKGVTGTLQLPAGLWDGIVTTAALGSNFVSDISGNVLKISAGATDSNSPALHISIPGAVPVWALAQAPDRTLYVAAGTLGNPSTSWISNEFLYAYLPGTTTPARTIGPFTQYHITALAVDAQGLVYVGTAGNQGGVNQVSVLAANATDATALRTITNAVPSYYEIKGLAISQP